MSSPNTINELGPVELEKFKGMLKEATDINIIIEAQKRNIADIRERAKEELKVGINDFKSAEKLALDDAFIQGQMDRVEELRETAIKLGFAREE